ncbi:MAG: pyocin activator PrtN family protein [Candidatus Reddybacter sp.]
MNTYFALLAEYDTVEIPLAKVCEKFFGLDPKTALRQASTQRLPVPVHKIGGQKSPWLVNAKDLAELIDTRRKQAAKDHKAMRAA